VKRKVPSLFLTLALLLSFSLVTAVPVSADYTAANYNASVIKAADRLVTLQNGDGGWPWLISAPGPSNNILGITSIGVLKAYRLDDKAAYEESLAKSYMYAVNTAPGWTVVDDKWKETTSGVNSWPDVTFLVWLAEAADDDASLLTAIQAQVTGTTATDIAALAKDRWDDRVNHLGALPPSETGTATAMAEWLRDFRHGQSAGGYPLDAYIPWDLEEAVKAGLALDAYYPDDANNYSQQVDDIVDVLFACVDDGTYFDSSDSDTQGEYILGLTGAIEASAETGLYTEKAAALKSILLALQEAGGSWAYYGPGVDPASGAAQSTAYAIMALFAQGDETARAAAFDAADWLVDTQNNGWHPSGGDSEEITEVDSECAWALYQAGIEISKQGVEMTTDIPTALAIDVSPTSIDFGTVAPISSKTDIDRTLAVANVGTWAVSITISIVDDTNSFYTQCLYHDTNSPAEALRATNYTTSLAASAAASPVLQVCVPPTWEAIGTQTGKIIIWAEGAE